jgi:hypothetical protein
MARRAAWRIITGGVTAAGLLTGSGAWAQGWQGSLSLGVEVTNPGKQPVPGAVVHLQFAEQEPYEGPEPATTDGSGRAVLYGLAEGLWRVRVVKEGFSDYLVVIRLDGGRKNVLVPAGPLRDATAPPLSVAFSKGGAPMVPVESEKRARRQEPRREERAPAERRRDDRRAEERRGERSGRDRESGRPRPPEPPPVPRAEPERRTPPAPEPPEEAPASPPPVPAQPTPSVTPPATPPPAAPPPSLPVLPATEAPPSPEPQPPASAEPAARLPDLVRSSAAGTCGDCKPGEVAVSAIAATPARAAGAACPAGGAERVLEAIRRLAAEPAPEAGAYAGPVVRGGRVVPLVAPAVAAQVEQLLAPWIAEGASCQLLLVVLPPTARFTGYRYQAADVRVGGDCLAGRDCPVGDAAFDDHPRTEKTAAGTFVFAFFDNRSAQWERRAEMSVYYRSGGR